MKSVAVAAIAAAAIAGGGVAYAVTADRAPERGVSVDFVEPAAQTSEPTVTPTTVPTVVPAKVKTVHKAKAKKTTAPVPSKAKATTGSKSVARTVEADVTPEPEKTEMPADDPRRLVVPPVLPGNGRQFSGEPNPDVTDTK